MLPPFHRKIPYRPKVKPKISVKLPPLKKEHFHLHIPEDVHVTKWEFPTYEDPDIVYDPPTDP